MFKTSFAVLALFLSSGAEAVHLRKSMLVSADPKIDPESFAEASVQARIEADQETSGKQLSQKESNEIWKKHFMASDFYKSYQQHLEARKGFEEMKVRD